MMFDHGTRRFALALFAHPSKSWQPSVPGHSNPLRASTVHPPSPQIGLHELGPPSQNLSQRNLPLHPLNAWEPIEVTLFGMVTDVRLLHQENAPFPIEVTLFEMVTDVRLVHLENAPPPIEVTLFGMED